MISAQSIDDDNQDSINPVQGNTAVAIFAGKKEKQKKNKYYC